MGRQRGLILLGECACSFSWLLKIVLFFFFLSQRKRVVEEILGVPGNQNWSNSLSTLSVGMNDLWLFLSHHRRQTAGLDRLCSHRPAGGVAAPVAAGPGPAAGAAPQRFPAALAGLVRGRHERGRRQGCPQLDLGAYSWDSDL